MPTAHHLTHYASLALVLFLLVDFDAKRLDILLWIHARCLDAFCSYIFNVQRRHILNGLLLLVLLAFLGAGRHDGRMLYVRFRETQEVVVGCRSWTVVLKLLNRVNFSLHALVDTGPRRFLWFADSDRRIHQLERSLDVGRKTALRDVGGMFVVKIVVTH